MHNSKFLERRFDLPYAYVPLDAGQLRAWEAPDQALAAELALPPRNDYIPSDFTLHCGACEDSNLSAAQQECHAAAQALCAGVPNQVSKRCNAGHSDTET